MKLEHHIQAEFHKWINKEYPQYRLLCYHIVNEQSGIGVAQLVGMGLVSGIPDYHIAVSNGSKLTMYIEFKKPDGKVSNEQKVVHERLIEQNHHVVVCYSVKEAIDEFKKYISL